MPPRKVEESATAQGQDDDGQQKELRAEEKRVDTARERVRVLTACARSWTPQADVFFFLFGPSLYPLAVVT